MDGTENADDLARAKIFDILTHFGPLSWSALGEATGFRIDKLRRLADHEWFNVSNSVVAIQRCKGDRLLAN